MHACSYNGGIVASVVVLKYSLRVTQYRNNSVNALTFIRKNIHVCEIVTCYVPVLMLLLFINVDREKEGKRKSE